MAGAERFFTALSESITTLEACRADETLARGIDRFVDHAARTFRDGGRLLACGNGGSMSDAMHFVEELCGRFRETRPALSAIAFSDPATLTCIANDFGFEEIFARQVEAHGRPGDLLVLMSTSGNSPNLVRAARVARELGVATVGLLGRGGGEVAREVDVSLVVPWTKNTERIQEAHLLVLHSVIESLEERLFFDASTTG